MFVYALGSGKEWQITDGISDARYPVFDKGGKYLLYAVSTDAGLTAGWLDLSSFQHPVLRSVYAAVLKRGDPSPVPLESDEEKVEPVKKDEKSPAKGAGPDKGQAKKGKEAEARYAPYLQAIGGREDLNYLFDEMLGEITVGHMFVGGGDVPESKRVSGGLLTCPLA